MNNYGVILDDIGFTPFLNEIRTRCVSPFASLLFRERGGDSLDGHHGFVVCKFNGSDMEEEERKWVRESEGVVHCSQDRSQ